MVRGSTFDIAVNIRTGSPTSAAGFADGFCVPAEVSEVDYKSIDFYARRTCAALLGTTRASGIAWSPTSPFHSEVDRKFGPLTPDRTDLPAYPREDR